MLSSPIAGSDLLGHVLHAPNIRNVTLLAELVIGQATHFPHGTEASALGRDARAWLDDYRAAIKDRVPAIYLPVGELIELHNRLCALVTARQAHSDTLAPTIEPSVSVTLWGSNADDRGTAYEHARDNLGGSDVTLADRTPVETNELIGTRYVFRAVSA